MENMESMNQSKLEGIEATMYKNFLAKNPGTTEDDFITLRNNANSSKSQGVQHFYALNGIIMEEKPDADEINEMKDNHSQE